ncbi:hypothetical protein [Haloarchaeobius sp. DFWS5]|uniref:hypothetical protein n=1 Tax=Haloarchaeobius sp. DFWS5 TaxID=3446114 RepID=UPI003EBB1379
MAAGLSTTATLAIGAVGGVAYLTLVALTMDRVYPEWHPRRWLPSSDTDIRGTVYILGGLWLTGALAVVLLAGFGVILPVGLLVAEYLVFVTDPQLGESYGPPSVMFWPLYVALFLVFTAVEYGSLLLVSGGPALAVIARHVVVGLSFAALVGVGLYAYLPVWRVVPISWSLPVLVENDGDEAHEVEVSVVDTTDDSVVYSVTHTVEANDSLRLEDAITRLGRYRIVGTLPDGSTDEYVFEPRRRAGVVGVIVWVDGELGHFRVIGQGSGP